jgi:hypothetical protein
MALASQCWPQHDVAASHAGDNNVELSIVRVQSSIIEAQPPTVEVSSSTVRVPSPTVEMALVTRGVDHGGH